MSILTTLCWRHFQFLNAKNKKIKLEMKNERTNKISVFERGT
jgi:hypothetical protein